MNILEKAISVAVNLHSGQTDKKGEPYILHPLRVMNDPELVEGIEGQQERDFVRAVAVLHDTLEDCDIGRKALEYQLSVTVNAEASAIAMEVETLSKREDEKGFKGYLRFVERVKKSTDTARRVKLADIRDNSNPARLEYLDESTRHYLQKKYGAALHAMGERIRREGWEDGPDGDYLYGSPDDGAGVYYEMNEWRYVLSYPGHDVSGVGPFNTAIDAMVDVENRLKELRQSPAS